MGRVVLKVLAITLVVVQLEIEVVVEEEQVILIVT